jgi:F-type H+-transporting ATPase subunit b
MLDIEPLLMAVTTVIFFVLLYQLNIKLYRPLLKFMDNRDMSIARDMEAAKNMTGNTDDLLAKAQANIDDAKVKASKQRQETIDEGKENAIKAIDQKQLELEKSGEEFAKKLDEERVLLQNSLQSQIPLVKESLKAKFSQL